MPKKKTTRFGSTLIALQRAEAAVQQLRQKAASQRVAHLKRLHSAFGFSSRVELIDALMAVDGAGRHGGRRTAKAGGTAAPAAARKSKRARVTPEMKSEIIKALKAGGPGGAVAKGFGVSSQTVQNIKKAAGLVKARKKASK